MVGLLPTILFRSSLSLIPGLGKPMLAIWQMITTVSNHHLSLLSSESWVPKSIALSNPERYATLFSPVMILLTKVSYPFVWLRLVSPLGL